MKKLLFLSSFAIIISAQTPTVTCAGGTNNVQEGQTITCSSTSSVTWSLIGGTGTLSGATTSSVTYTAPASITPQNVMAGCPVMPNDSIFNTRIDSLPLDPHSAQFVLAASLNDLTRGVGFGQIAWGTSTSTSSTPTKTLNNFYGGSTSGVPISTIPNVRIENGGYRTILDSQDHHSLNVRTDICRFYEAYNIHQPTQFSATTCNGGTIGNCNAQGSDYYGWGDYTTSSGLSGVDAAGLPLAPLTLHLSDFQNGVVNHALRFTTCNGCIDFPSSPLWPAAGQNGSSGTVPTPPPLGARFRLRLCGGGISTNCATLASFTANQQIVLTALNHYGMFLADIGSIGAITPGSDITLDRTVTNEITPQSFGVPFGDFEVVDESSLQFAAGSYETCPISQTCVGATNTYETPLNQAIIKATPTGSGSAVSTPIAIQGVTVSLNSPALWIEAAPFTYQIPAPQVNGTANQSVTWSLQSGVGSVTSGGIYTPPMQVYFLASNTSQFELGTRIESDINGFFTGCRFFKPPSGDTGTHTCSVWDDSGTLLKTVTFSGETSSGWQSQNFASALAITDHTPYWISYNTSGNFYYSQPFDYEITNSTMHVLQSIPGHTNGMYHPGSGFLDTSNYGSGYTSDVIFSTSSGGTSPLNIYTFTSVGKTAILKATSVADTNATAIESVFIVPHSAINDDGTPNSNSTSAIRIDSGNYTTNLTPTNSMLVAWQPEGALEQNTPGCCGDLQGNPQWYNWLSLPDLSVYETIGYGSGATTDFNYTFIVPNGNYKIKEMFASKDGAVGGLGSTIAPYASSQSRLHLDTQGDIKFHNWNYLLNNNPTGYAWISRTPTFIYVPAKVSNNILQIGLHSVLYDTDALLGGSGIGSNANISINGLEVIPDTTSTHWSIDTQQQTTVSPGSMIWKTHTLGATELGNYFLTNVSGYIKGCRFYKPVGETGTHTCTLWSVDGNTTNSFTTQTGTQLNTATFSGETSSGWQSVNFSSPTPITAGTQYAVSYYTSTGLSYYATTLLSPSQPFIHGAFLNYLGTLLSGAGGSFPNQTTMTSYAVDPIFSLVIGGTNPQTLFPNSNLPGQQVQLYLQDWYTGLNDPNWTLNGPGAIETNVDINNTPIAIYTAPFTAPNLGSGIAIKANSISTPTIITQALLYFTGTQGSFK